MITINRESQDLLDRAPLVEAIVNLVTSDSLREPDGAWVICVYGPWGSGKTFLKNLVLRKLRAESRPDRLRVVEFNPWMLSESPDLVAALFAEVGRALDSTVGAAKAKEARRYWRRYLARLGVGSTVAQAGVRALVAVLALSAFLFGTGHLLILTGVNSLLAVVIAVLATIIGVARFGQGILRELVRYLDIAIDESGEDLAETQQRLAEILGDARSTLLVVIDDLDRLTKEEIRQLIRAIKVNLNLPKVTFLLLADQLILEDALSGNVPGTGRGFVEKLVDVSIDLPEAPAGTLLAAFQTRLTSIGGAVGIEERDFSDDVRALWRPTLGEYLRNFREVDRLARALHFQVGVFNDHGTLTVHFADLVLLEVMRRHEPELYWRLCRNVRVLTTWLPPNSPEARLSDRQASVEAILSGVHEGRRATVVPLLCRLFPAVAEELSGTGVGVDTDQLLKERRVAREEVMETYVRRYPPPGVATPSDLVEVLSAKTRQQLVLAVRALEAQDKLISGTEQAIARVDLMCRDEPTQVLTGIMDLGESYRRTLSPRHPFGLESVFKLWVRRYLECFRDPKLRAEIFVGAVQQSDALSIPIWFDNDGASPNGPLFEAQSARERADSILRRIRRAAEDGSLFAHPQLGAIVVRWSGLAGDDGDGEVIDFLRAHMTTAEDVVATVRGFRPEAFGDHETTVASDERNRSAVNGLLRFFRREELTEAIRMVKAEAVRESDKGWWERLPRVLERQQ